MTQSEHTDSSSTETETTTKASDWSRTPAAMVSALVLGLAAITGLIWSVTTSSEPSRIHTQITQGPVIENQSAPARLLIDLNSAGIDELELLPSIGPKLAQRILDDREENGPYEALKDLDRVRGIGPKTIARVAEWVTIGAP